MEGFLTLSPPPRLTTSAVGTKRVTSAILLRSTGLASIVVVAAPDAAEAEFVEFSERDEL